MAMPQSYWPGQVKMPLMCFLFSAGMSASVALAFWNRIAYLSVMGPMLSSMRAGTLTVFSIVVSPVCDIR